jgi:hypothetical protein
MPRMGVRAVSAVELLKNAPKAGRVEAWSGSLRGAYAATGTVNVRMQMRLRFSGDIVDGAGLATMVPAPPGARGSRFQVTGSCQGDDIKLQFWFEDPRLKLTPFDLEGAFEGEGESVSGSWTFGCYHPDTCGCSGGCGSFEFARNKR